MSQENTTVVFDSRGLSQNSEKRDVLISTLTLLAFPLIQFFIFLPRVLNWTPIWSWYPDPGYPYLLNGAIVVSGGVPGHVDHPGTSLQWVIGLVEVLTHYFLNDGMNLFASLVSQPEFYAQIASIFLLISFTIAIIWMSFAVWLQYGLASAVVSQALMVWGIQLTASGIFKLVPETTVLIACLAILSLLMPILAHPRMQCSKKRIVLIGIFISIGLTSKIIFLPVVILVLLVLKFRDALLAFATALVSTVLIMVPTWPRREYMWDWYVGVLRNTRRHGEGESDGALTNLLSALDWIGGVLRWFPFVFLLLTCMLIFITVVTRLYQKTSLKSLISPWVIWLTILFTLAFGYKQSEARDFLLLVPLIAVLAGVLLSEIVHKIRGDKRTLTYYVKGGTVLISCFLAAHGLVGSIYLQRIFSTNQNVRVAAANQIAEIESSRSVAVGYGAWTLASGLTFGEQWSNGEFDSSISILHPRSLEYSVWDQNILTWENGGSGRKLLCSEIRDLIDNPGLEIIVESLGHLKISSDQTLIYAAQGQISVIQLQDIENYSRFQAIAIQCDPQVS